MISSTTLLVATLVFNAVSSLGAPVRIASVDSEVVARAEINEPVLRRTAFVEIEPKHKRSNLGRITRRSVRLPRELDTEIETRDTAPPSVDARDSIPEIDNVVRRYPRQHLHNFYEKRSQGHPSPRDAPDLERRFPRQALHARYAKREEGPAEGEPTSGDAATPTTTGTDAAASPSASASDASASPSASGDASASPSPTSSDASASPSATTSGDASATVSPSSTSTDSSSSATSTSASSTETASTSSSATATSTGTSPSATTSKGAEEAPVKPTPSAASTASSTAPAAPLVTKVEQASDIAGIVKAIEQNNSNGGFQPGQTTKETTVIVSKVTYNSDANKDKPVVSATTVTLGKPEATSSSTPADAPKPSATSTGEAEPSPSATSTDSSAGSATPPDGEVTPAAADAEASPAATEPEARSVFRRNLGFSGAAYASLLKRSLDLD